MSILYWLQVKRGVLSAGDEPHLDSCIRCRRHFDTKKTLITLFFDMPSAEKIVLTAIAVSLPVILPAVLAQLGAGRFAERRQKFGFVFRIAAISYSLAIAVAFFISTILRTFAPSVVTGRESVAPVFNFLSINEPTISLCILVFCAIGVSVALFPKRQSETGAP
jgi:hypothetical protein